MDNETVEVKVIFEVVKKRLSDDSTRFEPLRYCCNALPAELWANSELYSIMPRSMKVDLIKIKV